MAVTKKAKGKTCRLSKAIKQNYDHWLNWDYFGEKVKCTKQDADGIVREVEQMVAVNTIRSLNFWRLKDGLSGKRKQEDVYEGYRLYRQGEIKYGDLISFVNPISQKKIVAHNAGEATYFYCNQPFAQVANLLIDWDDKDRLFRDTEAAARWVDEKFLFGQSYIQPSTSGTGTHQYWFLDVDDVPVTVQKTKYSEFIEAMRMEVKAVGYRCWEKLDELKGIAPECSWHRSKGVKHAHNPAYLQIDVGGVFGKLPRLSDQDHESRWLNRKVVKWSAFTDLVDCLEQKHGGGKIEERDGEERRKKTRSGDIGGLVTATVDLPKSIEQDIPAEAEKAVVASRINDMFHSSNKQRASLATVFLFEETYGRRPMVTHDDFEKLNTIYNGSKTATDPELTKKRQVRFETAISFSKGRPKLTKVRLIAPESILRAESFFKDVNVASANEKLRRAKQRSLTPLDVGRVWCYFDTAYYHNKKTNEIGRVNWKSIKGLADEDFSYDKERYRKLSPNAISATLALFVKLKLIEVVEKPVFNYGADRSENACTKYRMLVDVLKLAAGSV